MLLKTRPIVNTTIPTIPAMVARVTEILRAQRAKEIKSKTTPKRRAIISSSTFF
jgi:hypothetical protein